MKKALPAVCRKGFAKFGLGASGYKSGSMRMQTPTNIPAYGFFPPYDGALAR
jgi:hypothetical protein